MNQTISKQVRILAIALSARGFGYSVMEDHIILESGSKGVKGNKNLHSVSKIESGEVTLDLASHEVRYRDLSYFLPAREFALMLGLSERAGTILSRSQLEEKLYGFGEEVESNAIDVLIFYIRKKFGPDIIRNIRGAGWMVPGRVK